jgi:hypothetical protein
MREPQTRATPPELQRTCSYLPPENFPPIHDSKGNPRAGINLRSRLRFWQVSAASDQPRRPGAQRQGAHRDTAVRISAHVAAPCAHAGGGTRARSAGWPSLVRPETDANDLATDLPSSLQLPRRHASATEGMSTMQTIAGTLLLVMLMIGGSAPTGAAQQSETATAPAQYTHAHVNAGPSGRGPQPRGLAGDLEPERSVPAGATLTTHVRHSVRPMTGPARSHVRPVERGDG